MTPGPAKRLVIYVGENQRWHHKPAWREIVNFQVRPAAQELDHRRMLAAPTSPARIPADLHAE